MRMIIERLKVQLLRSFHNFMATCRPIDITDRLQIVLCLSPLLYHANFGPGLYSVSLNVFACSAPLSFEGGILD